MLSFKEGLKLAGLKPEILIGLQVIYEVFKKYGYDVVVTEGTGGNHLPNSLHYKGLALDLRSKHISNDTIKSKIVFDCVVALGENYDCFLENANEATEHLHFEFDPKEKI